MNEPVLEFAFEIRVDVDPYLRIGRSADEELSFTPIAGGTVAGPLLNGEVLPGGGDWAVERSGTAQLEARYLLRADDGAVIDILNRGFWRADPEIEARVEAGEDLTEDQYYYRTQPVFQTDAEPYAWLTSTVFIGMARGEEGKVCIRFFELA